MVTGEIQLPKMKDVEISPGIFIVGEPWPIAGTDKLHSLANVNGMLAIIELRLKFGT